MRAPPAARTRRSRATSTTRTSARARRIFTSGSPFFAFFECNERSGGAFLCHGARDESPSRLAGLSGPAPARLHEKEFLVMLNSKQSSVVLCALALAACGGDDKQAAAPLAQQCPPGQYFDGQICQTQGAPAA